MNFFSEREKTWVGIVASGVDRDLKWYARVYIPSLDSEGVMLDFFFFSFTSAESSSESELEDDEGAGDGSRRFEGDEALALAANLLGSTYFTLTKILFRRESGLGRFLQLGSDMGARRPLQVFSMISTITSCCSALAWTSRLAMTGRSLKLPISRH